MSTPTTTVAPTHDDRAQSELDAIGKALRRYADRKRPDHAALMQARAEAVAMACGYTELNAMGEPVLVRPGLYSALDVLSWLARAVEMGAAVPRIGGDTVERVYRGELVPNAIFREIVERRGSLPAIAQKVGLVKNDGSGDDRNLERLLGIVVTHGKPGYPKSLRTFITHEQAVALAAALELDPYQVGI